MNGITKDLDRYQGYLALFIDLFTTFEIFHHALLMLIDLSIEYLTKQHVNLQNLPQQGANMWKSMELAFASLVEKFVFLHIRPHNKDNYDHIQCSTALL